MRGVCVCRVLQLLNVRVSLVTFLVLQLQNKINLQLHSRVMASFAYFEGHCRLFRLLCSNISLANLLSSYASGAHAQASIIMVVCLCV